MKKKYKLLRDLPRFKAGLVHEETENDQYPFSEMALYPDWFEPLEEVKEEKSYSLNDVKRELLPKEEAKECEGRGFILDPEYEVSGKPCFTTEGMEKAKKREPSDLIISAARKLEVAKTDFNAALIMSTLDFLDQELPKLLNK